MLVYVCRHATAAAGDPDELRPLTAAGEDEARRLAMRLAATPVPPALVVSSPLLRARQTAEAIAQAAGVELRVDARLAPGATASDLQAVVAGKEFPVATVGHQPDCSEIALVLTGTDPGFPPAGMTAIELGG